MSKLRAALIHFCISAMVVGPVLAVIFFLWYPTPFFDIVGAWDVVRVLVGVDLVLGPFLTFIVYKKNKPRLKFDLAVIAVVQLTALVYGVDAIYQERPYYMVFAVDRFSVLAEKDVDAAELDRKRFKKPLVGPIYALAQLPEDTQAQQALLFEILQGAPDIDRRPEFWSVYEISAPLKRAKPLGHLAGGAPGLARLINRLAEANGHAVEQLVYLPAMGKQDDVSTLILDKSSGEVLATLPVNPWTLEVG